MLHPTMDYPGIPINRASIVENHSVLQGVRIPVRPHFGVIAVAPAETGLVDSVPPSCFGGNLDNWRIAKGATLYLRVGVDGALLSVGDPHASQGDSELCGTAIECSLTGVFQIVLHKADQMTDKPFADIDYPLVETADEWVIHGSSHPDYLKEFGDKARSAIYEKSSLDPAMRDAFRKTRRFLMTAMGLTEDEAISLMSIAVDFGVTQVVDGNWGGACGDPQGAVCRTPAAGKVRSVNAQRSVKTLLRIEPWIPQLASTTCVTPKFAATDNKAMASSSLSLCTVIRKRRSLRKPSRMAGSSEDFSAISV